MIYAEFPNSVTPGTLIRYAWDPETKRAYCYRSNLYFEGYAKVCPETERAWNRCGDSWRLCGEGDSADRQAGRVFK